MCLFGLNYIDIRLWMLFPRFENIGLGLALHYYLFVPICLDLVDWVNFLLVLGFLIGLF